MKQEQGSITVEASLIIPVFIYTMAAFLYFFQLFLVQENIQKGITTTAQCASQYTYIQKNINPEKIDSIGNSVLDKTFLYLTLQKNINTSLINASCIQGGTFGISLIHSSISTEENIIDVIAVYRVHFPLLFFSIKDYTLVQRVRTKGFIGKSIDKTRKNGVITEDEISSDEIVYITETGNVYHLSKSCTYLNLSIHLCEKNQLDGIRNLYGAKYKKCERCCTAEEKNSYYITESGDRYHSDLNCSGLKRTIYEVLKSQVGTRNLCSRCANK